MPDRPFQLHSLRRVSLRTRSFAAGRAFYARHWGLEEVGGDDDRVQFRGTGPEHHILELVRSPSNGLDHLAFGVRSPGEVDRAAAHIEAAGVELINRPGALEHAAGGYGFRFEDPERRVIEVSAECWSNAPRGDDVPTPRKLAHVVLNTADLEGSEAFYREVLGFAVSDWSERQMVFLRINADHHSIAFNRADWASVNHVAYELPSIDHYMRSIGRLKQAGVEPLWGPGRHGPGNNTFAYYADTAGFVCEFTSEVAQVPSDYLPRVWRRVPDQSDLWGTAGPPSPDARAHMAGEADPGPRHAVDPSGS